MTRIRMRVAVALLAVAVLAAFGLYRTLLHATPVRVEIAAAGSVPVRIAGPGNVKARIAVTLGARMTASVVRLAADQGDSVKRGQLLALLDDRDLAARRASVDGQQEALRRNVEAARATAAKAQADLDLARSKYRRDADLFGTGYLSQASLDASSAALRAAQAGLDNAHAALAARQAELGSLAQEARYAEVSLSHARIASPIDGIVVERVAEVGNTVVPGGVIYRLVDPSTLWVATRVDESVAGRVRLGMGATIRLRTGGTLPGKVARIARQADAAARELEVDVAFDAPPARFAIDQEAEVTIQAGDEPGLVVPVGALLESSGRQGVLVVREGRARFQPVETGAADAARVVVRKGLAAGEAVLAAPQGVPPGGRVRAVAAGD